MAKPDLSYLLRLAKQNETEAVSTCQMIRTVSGHSVPGLEVELTQNHEVKPESRCHTESCALHLEYTMRLNSISFNTGLHPAGTLGAVRQIMREIFCQIHNGARQSLKCSPEICNDSESGIHGCACVFLSRSGTSEGVDGHSTATQNEKLVTADTRN